MTYLFRVPAYDSLYMSVKSRLLGVKVKPTWLDKGFGEGQKLPSPSSSKEFSNPTRFTGYLQ